MRGLLFVLFLVSFAMVGGPCAFDNAREFDCDAVNVCPQAFACTNLGFCQSADTACRSGIEVLCANPEFEQVGECVPRESFENNALHCGGCFNRCRGDATCVEGECVDEPAEGACVASRGNDDCAAEQACVDGLCVANARGEIEDYASCSEGGECSSGLCSEGVCVRACRDACAFGYECDAGVCAPLSCKGAPGICAAGTRCDASKDACTKDAQSCSKMGGEVNVLFFALLFLARFRRRVFA